MCGVAGIMAYGAEAPRPEESELLAMREHMRARGPDGAGLWRSLDDAVLLAHRRLAILDLSARAAQPMSSEDGRFVIVFNGEIYNYRALRAELEARGERFLTTSDTEILLRLFAREGIAMLARLRGMFAFAIYDATERRLHLARDPYGVKPLYYADDGRSFRFASQVKALLAGGGVDRRIDNGGVAGFCLLGSVPEPFTLYEAISAVPAGCFLSVDARGVRAAQPFASIAQRLASVAPQPRISRREHVKAALRESVAAHLVADVDVGLFLSGGVDSGALLGLMRDCGVSRLRAVTLAFEEFSGLREDEAPMAARIAAHYGAQHSVRRVSQGEFEADLPALLAAMDQPSIDGVNMWFVAKAAREAGLKVALSGVGGDELLAGYPSFYEIPFWARMTSLAHRSGVGPWIRRAGAALFPRLFTRNPKLFSLAEYGGSYEGAYLLRRGVLLPHQLASIIGVERAEAGLERLRFYSLARALVTPDPGKPRSRVCALESGLYLRNQLLRDADWAGMAHSVEVRTPFVDYTLLGEIAPFIAGLNRGDGKALLAAAPGKALPRDVLARGKTGFGVPMRAWLGTQAEQRNVSRGWAQQVLAAHVGALS